MTPEEIAECDQAFAVLADTLPPFLKRFYDNLKEEGFKDHEALSLTRSYLTGFVSRNNG